MSGVAARIGTAAGLARSVPEPLAPALATLGPGPVAGGCPAPFGTSANDAAAQRRDPMDERLDDTAPGSEPEEPAGEERGIAPDADDLERRSEAALDRGTAGEVGAGTGEELPSSGLLSFYDRLRERVTSAVEHRGGKMADASVRALLLVPDIFILLVRLSLDKEVPASARMMIGGALAYFVLPLDLMPEAIIGAGGYLDDLVLAVAVLSQAFSGELEPYARKHWSGSEDIRKVVQDVTYAAENLLGAKVYDRLKNLLGRRGIELPENR